MNDIVNLNIVDMTEDGKGIGKTEDNFTVFTDSALPGDKVIAKIYKKKKNYAEARTLEYLEFSPSRQERLCPTDVECGGCDFMDYKYEAQMELKQNKIENILSRIADVDISCGTVLQNIISPEKLFNYRNKAILHNDKGVIGYFSKKSNDVVNMKDCLINSDYAVKIKHNIADLFKRIEEPLFSDIKDILVRSSKDNKSVMLVFIANSKKDNKKLSGKFKKNAGFSKLVKELVNDFPEIKSVILNINSSNRFLLGKESQVIFGKDHIVDAIENLEFKISPETFFQINAEITEKMYDKVLEYCDLNGSETVYDIYSGIGTISLFLANKADKVIGIEIVEKSVENARENAKINNIQNAEFEYGKAENLFPEHSNAGKKADVIVVDPPRKGCEKEVLSAMVQMNPEKIVYVSCNPATLGRDLNILSENYRIEKVQPFDMFPWTNHVETVVLLMRK